ncbi:hypothetical protein MRB53_026129 [Persea americana]|uniref:Uncharacterized protein n=1 Tax=Persea americana TaxID=3435 RepID=A0ACC2LHZ9_PERAE|nr:hypothetical protein MRB53_026129 [Persea americana]
MSGGISNMMVEDLHVWDAAAGLRVKIDRGRGGYISNSTIASMTMERVKIPIRFSSGSNDHPDEWWDPNALPVVRGIFIGGSGGEVAGAAGQGRARGRAQRDRA